MDRMPAEAFPVALFVREECEARGWSFDDLARRMGAKTLNALNVDRLALDVMEACSYMRGVCLDQKMADSLSLAFGVSAQFFLALDESFIRWRDAQSDEALAEADKRWQRNAHEG